MQRFISAAENQDNYCQIIGPQKNGSAFYWCRSFYV